MPVATKSSKCARKCSQCEIKHEFICPVIVMFEIIFSGFALAALGFHLFT